MNARRGYERVVVDDGEWAMASESERREFRDFCEK